MRCLIIVALVMALCVPVSAHGNKFSETAKEFIEKYRVEVMFYPEDIVDKAVEVGECVECRSFDKTHNIEAYKEHAKQIQSLIDYNDKYIYTKYYVGYDVYREHLFKHHRDEKFIGAKVYVSPTDYRTQAVLQSDAAQRRRVVSEVRQRLSEHMNHIQNGISDFLK